MRSLTNSSVRGTSQIAVDAAGFVKADASGFLSTVAAAGANVTESETPPSSPAAGDLWYNTAIGRMFVWYSSAWVESNPAVSGPAGPTGPTGSGVPAGGTTGQYLVKTNGTDYATQWYTLDLSTYAPLTNPVFQNTVQLPATTYLSPSGGTASIGGNMSLTQTLDIAGNSVFNGTVNIASGGGNPTSRTVNIGTNANTGYTSNVNIGSNANSSIVINGTTTNYGPIYAINNTVTSTDPFYIQSKNGHGGATFGGITTWENTGTGATNTKKYWRINPTGSLEIVNNAYSAVIFSLADNGDLSAINNLTVNGGINGVNLNNNAWASYTPSLRTNSGTITLGNGTVTGAYKQIGKTVHFRAKFVCGSTTSIGANEILIGLPVTAASSIYQFAGSMLDNGNAWYQITGNGDYIGSTTEFAMTVYSGTGRSAQGVSNTVPFSFLTGDYISISGTYEAA